MEEEEPVEEEQISNSQEEEQEEQEEEEEEVGSEFRSEQDYEYYGDTPEYESPSMESLPPMPDIITPEGEEEERKPKKKPSAFWKRPTTKVYPDTFTYFVNSYQPMIDYLDLKDSGHPVRKSDVYLPLSEERCLEKYSSNKPIKWYTNTDIDRYIAKGEKIRTDIRQNDAIGASSVLHRTHTNWSMTRKFVQSVKNSYVIDPRTGKSASKPSKVPVIPRYSLSRPSLQKFLLIPLTSDYSSPTNMVDVATAHQIDHDAMMSARRRRMRDIDGQMGSSIDHMSATVDLLNRQGPREDIDIPISQADDLLVNNRSRRMDEMDRMMDKVDDLTNMGSERNVARRMYSNELTRIQSERLCRRPAKSQVIYVENPVLETDLEFLKTRRGAPVVVDMDTPRYRRPREDTVSDVQGRVFQRANELSGMTSEMRRINNRSKYLNVLGPRSTADTVPTGYTSTSDNIDYMARQLAAKGKAARRLEADEELDEINDMILSANINMLRKTYATDPVKPREPSELASNSVRVREAQSRAGTRNALLHGY